MASIRKPKKAVKKAVKKSDKLPEEMLNGIKEVLCGYVDDLIQGSNLITRMDQHIDEEIELELAGVIGQFDSTAIANRLVEELRQHIRNWS